MAIFTCNEMDVPIEAVTSYFMNESRSFFHAGDLGAAVNLLKEATVEPAVEGSLSVPEKCRPHVQERVVAFMLGAVADLSNPDDTTEVLKVARAYLLVIPAGDVKTFLSRVTHHIRRKADTICLPGAAEVCES